MTQDRVGMIVVSRDSIIVRVACGSDTIQSTYAEATIENLQDAARVLAAWMDLKFEDVSAECQRVHQRDQFDSVIRDMIKESKRT